MKLNNSLAFRLIIYLQLQCRWYIGMSFFFSILCHALQSYLFSISEFIKRPSINQPHSWLKELKEITRLKFRCSNRIQVRYPCISMYAVRRWESLLLGQGITFLALGALWFMCWWGLPISFLVQVGMWGNKVGFWGVKLMLIL